jgi:hypothetical protein
MHYQQLTNDKRYQIKACLQLHMNQIGNAKATNNDPRLPPGFPKPLPPLDKEEIKQTDALITEADGIIATMDSLIAGLNLPVMRFNNDSVFIVNSLLSVLSLIILYPLPYVLLLRVLF